MRFVSARPSLVCSLVVATTLLSAGSGLAQTTSKWSYGFVDGGNIVAFAEESSSGTTVYAASSGGIFKTTNSGDNWNFLANSPAQMTKLAWDASASILYAANSITAWKSTDHGATWSQIYHSGMTPATYPGGSEVTLSLTGLVAGGGAVYLSYTETLGATGPLLMSADAGKTWEKFGPEMPFKPSGIVYCPKSRSIYAWRSTENREDNVIIRCELP